MLKFSVINKNSFLISKLGLLILSIFFGLFLVNLLIRTGISSDHLWYLNLWEIEQAGGNPYTVQNPYGPINSFLGLLLSFGTLAPKLFMFFVFSILLIYIAKYYIFPKSRFREKLFFILIIPLNFFVIYSTVIVGFNDTFIASLVGAAIVFKLKNNINLIVICLVTASLFKFYPLLLIPFFAIEKGRLNKEIIVKSTVLFLSSYLLAIFYYGLDLVKENFYSASRFPSLLSPLEGLWQIFIVGDTCNSISCASVLQIFILLLVYLNPIIVVLVSMISFFMTQKYSLNWLESSVICLLVALTFYKTVHPQFFLTWLVLYLFLLHFKTDESKKLFLNLLPVVLFLQIFSLSDYFRSYVPMLFSFLYHFGGFIFFPLVILSLFRYFYSIQKV